MTDTVQELQPARANVHLRGAPAAGIPAQRAPQRPGLPSAPPWRRAWKTCAVTLLAWGVILVLHMLSIYHDTLAAPEPEPLSLTLLPLLPPFTVMAMVACALALAFERWTEAMLRPRTMLWQALLLIAVAVPLENASAAALELLLNGKSLALLPAALLERPDSIWWIDVYLTALAYLTQAAYAAWWRGQAQALACYRAQTEGLQLRLRLLQGQLEPHFLFNALNSISALVRTADRELAALALNRLSDLLHYVVQASQHEWLSVADELAFLGHYLELQMLRYGERMSIEWDLGEAPWAQLACPPLLFQPLVENAIHHGVEQHHDQCSVRIVLRQEQGMIRFAIDNPVLGQAAPRKGHGLGLAAIRERIAILYGQQASLRTSFDPHGFLATLTFPARARDEY